MAKDGNRKCAKQTFKFEYNLRTLKLLDIPSMNVDLNVRLVLAPYKGFLPVPLFGYASY